MRLTLLCLALLLSGCSRENPETRLHDYAYRVGNAIEHPYTLNFASLPPAYPAKRNRALPTTDIREGLIDVLELRHCGLLELVGQRNSSLGKFALPSQRLIYETRFLPLLRRCINNLAATDRDNEDARQLLKHLQSIEQIKHHNYPAVISNAIFNSDEISRHFARGGKPLDTTALQQLNGLIPALEHFQQMAVLSQHTEWEQPDRVRRLEQDYEAFYRSDFGADWLHSLLLLTQTLEQTAHAIETRMARRPLCFKQRPTPQARIIQNVLQRYYAGQLQPWMSGIDRSGRLWRQHWLDLLEQLPTTPEVTQYFSHLFGDRPDSLWQQYVQARDRHTRAWQSLLKQCGMMPGANEG